MKRSLMCIMFILILISLYADERPSLLILQRTAQQNILNQDINTLEQLVINIVVENGSYTVTSNTVRDAALKELEFQGSDIANSDNQLQLGKMTAASYILLIGLSKSNDYYYCHLTLIQVETGIIINDASKGYRSISILFDLVKELVYQIFSWQDPSQIDENTYLVKNVSEFLDAIGPERTIILKSGKYNLSGAHKVENDYIDWPNNYDGEYPVLRSLRNLRIIGEFGAEIQIDPAYGWVLSFDTCRNIRLENLIAGHTSPGYCSGGVLQFLYCSDIEVRNCDLYGCGTYGLETERCTRVKIQKSIIRDCTYGIANIFNSENVEFENCNFVENGEFILVDVQNSIHVFFLKSNFLRNWGSSLLNADVRSRDLLLRECVIKENQNKLFIQDPGLFLIENCHFINNRFDH